MSEPGCCNARNALPQGKLVWEWYHFILAAPPYNVFIQNDLQLRVDAAMSPLFLVGYRWMKLNSKAGRKEKERGEMQVTVQFTRNNMTASMFDLNMQDKPRSAFGKLKDRVTGRKRGDVESSSAILPGRFAAVSGNLSGQHSGEGGGVQSGETEVVVEEKRSKVKDFFKGKLRRSSDTRSCSSLASESSVSSLASDNLGPPPSLDLLADPPSSPIYTSKVRVDSLYGEADLAKKGRLR